jgi:hypothetical protein
MTNIWQTAGKDGVDEVERLVAQNPVLLDAKSCLGYTPLMCASTWG